MTETELIERLAAATHASWARYMGYLLDKLEVLSDGALYINAAYVDALRRQIALPYSELTEAEQQADRDEVAYFLPLIRAYVAGFVTAPISETLPDGHRAYRYPFAGNIPPYGGADDHR